MSSSNVTLHGKNYQSGNIVPIAVNSAGELIIDSGGAIDLANLGDVSIAGLANNNLLQYDGTTNYWVNRSSLGGNIGFEALHATGPATLTNLWASGNLSISGLSNLSAVGISGNLDVLGQTQLANLSAGNLVITGMSNLVEVGISANLDVLGTTQLANLSAGNLIISGLANITGTATFGSNILIIGDNLLILSDANTTIHATTGGNLDITNTAGNVNISAEQDITLTTNTGSTIKLVGSSEQMLGIANPSTGNIYLNFGSVSGNSGYGIWSDNGTLMRKNLGDPGWVALSSGGGGSSNLADLSDVQLTLPLSNLDLLQYDITAGKWVNTQNLELGGNLIVPGLSNLAEVGISGNLDVLGQSNLSNISGSNLSISGLSNLSEVGISGNLDVLGLANLSNISGSNLSITGISNLSEVGISGNLDVLGLTTLSNISGSNLSITGLSNLAEVGISGNLDVLGTTNLANISGSNLSITGLSNLAEVGVSGNLDVLGLTTLSNISGSNLSITGLSNLAEVGVSGNLDVLGLTTLSNISGSNLSITGLSNLAEVGISGNLDVLGTTNLANISGSNLSITGLSNLAEVGVSGNLSVIGLTTLANISGSNLSITGLSNLAEVGVSGNLSVIGLTNLSNISGSNLSITGLSNLAEVGVSGNLDVLGLTTLANISGSNLSITGLSNLAEVGVSGNLSVIGLTNLSNISGSNLSITGLSNLAEVGVSGNLSVLGTSNLANVEVGNLTINGAFSLNDIVVPGNLSVLGTSNLANLSVGNIQILDAGRLEFAGVNTYIQSGMLGNLDIWSLDGNINITANHDIVLTANAPSTIRLVGPGNAPIASFNVDAGGNAFMSFGGTSGEAGYGIKADAGGNVLIKSLGADWGSIGNTQISIAGRTVALGGSNTIGFENLDGMINADTQITMGTIQNDKLANSGITIGTTSISLGGSSSIGFGDITGSIDTGTQITAGSIGTDKLFSDSITIGSSTISLGTPGNVYFSDLSGTIDSSMQIPAASIGNDKLTNDTITIGTTSISLGGSSSIGFSDITGSIDTTTQITAGSIGTDKLTSDSITIGSSTVSLGVPGNINFSDLSGNIAATQIDPASITNDQLAGSITNSKLSNSNIIIGGQTILLGGSGSLAFSNITGNIAATQIDPASITNDQLAGSITNSKLSNSNIIIGGQTILLGGSGSLAFSNITGNISATQISTASITNDQLAGSITNSKLSNSNIIIGGQTINLGGSGSLAFSNITGNIAATQISPTSITNDQLAGSITNSKLANSNIIIGGQTINLGGSGNIGLSNLSDVVINGLAQSNTLIYDSGTSKWINTARNVFSSGLTINGTIDGVSSPSTSLQAANKDYVDTVAQGLSLKTSARVATTTATANLTIGTFLVNGASVDGITLATGNRVLVKNQSNGIQNGIYSVLATAGTASRVSDMAVGSNAAGVFCFIQEGTQNGDCGFVCSNNSGSDVVGTNSLDFVQFSSAGVIQAGTALEKVGTTLNVLRTSILPIGCIQQYAGSSAPNGWLLCDGSSLSNITYADLRTVIGGTYGSGAGTFNLPNLQGRIPVGRNATETEFDTLGETGGEKTVILTSAQMPAHQHFVVKSTAYTAATTPAVSTTNSVKSANDYGDTRRYEMIGTSSVADVGLSSSTGSGGSHNNLQPYIVLNYIIYTGVYT